MSNQAYDALKVYKLGDPELAQRTGITSKTGEVQDYETLKSQYAGVGFKDPAFPHNNATIGNIGYDLANPDVKKDQYPIVWLRAKDALKTKSISIPSGWSEPKNDYQVKFSFDGCSRFDVNQGSMGNCYYVSSLAALATIPTAFEWAVPSDNNDDKDSGVYHFRMWHKGCWIDIVVDDYLPFKDAGTCYFVYGSKLTPNEKNEVEIWVQLAEKAYAKLLGSYQALAAGGFDIRALQQLTGGFTEGYELTQGKFPSDLFDKIKNLTAKENDRLLICLSCKSTTGPDETPDPMLDDVNLKYPHSYTVVAVDTVKTKDGREEQLVRIRNPHGKNEFTGNWSDGSASWQAVLDSEKERLQLQYGKDQVEGEFWMEFDDVVKFFDAISIISLFDRETVKSPTVFEAYQGTFDDPSGEHTGFTIDVGTADGSLSPIIVEAIPETRPNRQVEIYLYQGSKPEFPPAMEDQIFQILAGIPAGTEQPIRMPDDRILHLDPGKVSHSIPPIEGTKKALNLMATSQCLGWNVQPGRYTIIPTCQPGLGYTLRVLYSKSD